MKRPYRRINVPAWACTCLRCGHQWTAYTAELPRSCASCKHTGWAFRPGDLKPGRKPPV